MHINEKTGLYENYGEWHIPFWQTESFLLCIKIAFVLLCLLVIGLLTRIYMLYRKRKKLTAWEQALYDVEQLKKEHKLYSENGKNFYLAISTIIKTYLNRRFNYDLLGKTDAEVVEFLLDHYPNAQIVNEIKELLLGGVFVKFANAHVAQERINKDYDRIISIIKLTIPEKK